MITFIRSLSELMAITESRDIKKKHCVKDKTHSSSIDSGQRKRYIRSLNRRDIDLPNLPKAIREKWQRNKESVSRFIADLDYNNQIQSSYDLTLIDRQNKTNQRDVA